MTTAVAARAEALMGTVVTIDVSGPGADVACERAFGWFRHLEAHCSRFDERSELRQLTARAGEAVAVSAILFEAVRFAVSVAEESGGAFDPTVGVQMERRGFNREHRTGRPAPATVKQDDDVTYRDLALDAARGTITLRRPLVLDLGAVVKGLALDLAARELEPFGDFAVNAGGDLYLGGRNALRVGRRRLLLAGRGARRQRVGGLAPNQPADAGDVPVGDRRVPAGEQPLASTSPARSPPRGCAS